MEFSPNSIIQCRRSHRTKRLPGSWCSKVAYQLRVKWGLEKGDRAILAFNFGLRFFVVFLGCLRAGVVAVPVYPPSPAALKKSLRKLQLIVDSCAPKVILMCPSVNKLRQVNTLRYITRLSRYRYPISQFSGFYHKAEVNGRSAIFHFAIFSPQHHKGHLLHGRDYLAGAPPRCSRIVMKSKQPENWQIEEWGM